MAGVLEQLQQWAAQSTGQQPSCEPGLLPTVVLSLAASTNTAEAYAHLLVTMKQQVRRRSSSSTQTLSSLAFAGSRRLTSQHAACKPCSALHCTAPATLTAVVSMRPHTPAGPPNSTGHCPRGGHRPGCCHQQRHASVSGCALGSRRRACPAGLVEGRGPAQQQGRAGQYARKAGTPSSRPQHRYRRYGC
jgi:hypothetical protein